MKLDVMLLLSLETDAVDCPGSLWACKSFPSAIGVAVDVIVGCVSVFLLLTWCELAGVVGDVGVGAVAETAEVVAALVA